MKSLWFRVGMTVNVDDETYERLINAMNNEDGVENELVELIRTKGILDGESYAPAESDSEERLERDYEFTVWR